MDMREEAERSCSLVEHAEVADTREGFAAEVAESLVGVLAWTTMGPFGAGRWEADCLALSDDLADVWRHLKRGLLGLEAGADDADVSGSGAGDSTGTGGGTPRRPSGPCTPVSRATAPRPEPAGCASGSDRRPSLG